MRGPSTSVSSRLACSVSSSCCRARAATARSSRPANKPPLPRLCAMWSANGRNALFHIRNELTRNGNGNHCGYLDDMTYHRHNAALQQAGLGPSMAIGEFGGAPAVPGDSSALLSAAPMYWFYEMSHAALSPASAWPAATRLFYKNRVNPLSFTTFGKSVAAAAELFERSTRRYSRPERRITSTLAGGER